MQLDEVERIRYHLLVSQIIFGAGYCMLLYDWLCGLNREFKFIWKTKLSFIKAIYLFCRYWPIATIPYVLWVYTVPQTWETCQWIFRIPVAAYSGLLGVPSIVATWNQLSAETVLLARTVAFLGNSHLILYSLSACLVAATAYQNWVVFKPMFLLPFIADDRYGVCIPTTPGYEFFGFFMSSLLFDTLVTVLMVYRVFQLRQQAGGQFSRNPLVQLFVSEGLWYFVVVSAANLVNAFMFTLKEKSLQVTAVPFSNMLPTILACRLILDLRELHGSTEGNAWLTTGKGNVGFVLPAYLYRSKPGPTPPHLSTIRFQNPHNINSLHPGVSATDSSGLSTTSDLRFVDGAGHKSSFMTGSTSIGGAEVGDEDEVVDARGVLISAMKFEEEEAGTPAGVDNEFDLAYQMRPIRSQRETASKTSQEERRGDNMV